MDIIHLWFRSFESMTRASPLVTHPDILLSRITKRITRPEFSALCLGIGILSGFAYFQWQGLSYPPDFTVYMNAVRGDVNDYYYAYWFLPIFKFFLLFPIPLGYLLWGLLNLCGVWLATRVFGGPNVIVLLSYQMMYILYYGQITGIILGGLALMWLSIIHHRYLFAGFCFVLAATKVQIGLIFGLLLLLYSPITLKNKLLVLIPFGIVTLLSLFLYPNWPWQLVQTIQQYPPKDWGNISLWQWIGPWTLFLLFPAILLPLNVPIRFITMIATASITLPYFQQTDLLMFFCLPIGRVALLGYIGYLYPYIGWDILRLLSIPPLVWIIIQAMSFLYRKCKDDTHQHPKT